MATSADIMNAILMIKWRELSFSNDGDRADVVKANAGS
jgi:hypothetical protein